MPQIQGVEGEAKLLRTLDNTGDGVSSAFPKGKQNEALKGALQLTYKRDIVLQTKLKMPFVVNIRPLHNLVSLFHMRFLTHLRAHLLNRKNSA
jgi:hypothetical protein